MQKHLNASFVKKLEPEYTDFMRRAEEIRWTPQDVNYHQIDYSKLTREDLFAVFVTLHIENYSDVYTKLLIESYADMPLVQKFILNWEREEENHARVLEKYLMTVGIPLEELRANYAKVSKDAFPVPTRNQSGLNVFVFIQELLTREMYSKILRATKEPVLQNIMKRVVRDEERHFRFYKHALNLRMSLDRKDTLKEMLKVVRVFTMPQTMFRQTAMTDQLMEYYQYSGAEMQKIIQPITAMLEASTPKWMARFPKLQNLWKMRRAPFFAVQSPYLWGHVKIAVLRFFGLGAVSKRDKAYVGAVVDRLNGLLESQRRAQKAESPRLQAVAL